MNDEAGDASTGRPQMRNISTFVIRRSPGGTDDAKSAPKKDMTTPPETFENPCEMLASPPAETPRRLSEDLRAILTHAEGRAITIDEIEGALRGRGVAMLILILAAPFIVPVPGLSVPFGIAICLLGLRIAVGNRSALPRFLREKAVPHATLQRIVTGITRIVVVLERRIRPRMHFLRTHPRMVNLIGVGIISGGFILSLPLPIPFSNLFPAVSIMCLAAGLMERDGLLVLAGYVLGVLSWFYLGLWWQAVVVSWEHFGHWFH